MNDQQQPTPPPAPERRPADPLALDSLGPMPSRVIPWSLRERLARFDPPPAPRKETPADDVGL